MTTSLINMSINKMNFVIISIESQNWFLSSFLACMTQTANFSHLAASRKMSADQFPRDASPLTPIYPKIFVLTWLCCWFTHANWKMKHVIYFLQWHRQYLFGNVQVGCCTNVSVGIGRERGKTCMPFHGWKRYCRFTLQNVREHHLLKSFSNKNRTITCTLQLCLAHAAFFRKSRKILTRDASCGCALEAGVLDPGSCLDGGCTTLFISTNQISRMVCRRRKSRFKRKRSIVVYLMRVYHSLAFKRKSNFEQGGFDRERFYWGREKHTRDPGCHVDSCGLCPSSIRHSFGDVTLLAGLSEK